MLSLALVLVAVSQPVVNGDEMKPKWKWEKQFYLECSVASKDNFHLETELNPETTKTSMRLVFKVTPSLNTDGTVKLVHEIKQIQYLESTEDKSKEKKLLSKMIGGKFTTNRAKDGALTPIQGMAELTGKVFSAASTDDPVKKQTAQFENLFATMFESLLSDAYFPLAPGSEPDDAIALKQTLSFAGFLTMKSEKKYAATQAVVIDGKSYLGYRMTAKSSIHIPEKPSTLIPFKVVDVKLPKPIQHSAEMAFDPTVGRAQRVVVKISGDMSITIDVEGMKLKLTGNEERTLTILFSDDDPETRSKPKQ
jgi:hypothetical protein